jgi:hypothetical protein
MIRCFGPNDKTFSASVMMKHVARLNRGISSLVFAISAVIVLSSPIFAADFQLHSFDRKELTDVYYSEGAAVGDINRDGIPDLVYGPYWYEGPTFEKKHEIYAPKPQPLNFYADNFFTWVYDFNGDGWPDLLVVGLPGTPAFVFENPGAKGDGHWVKHQVFDSVGNESPQFVDLLGDKRPVLVCTHKGTFGFVTPNREKPFEAWTFHVISEKSVKEGNPHGLGIGDLNGDGRQDVLIASGWFEQPASDAESATWKFHAVPFSDAYGGAEMYVYDVNGDGKNDVITSLAAHDFGLAWYEQDTAGGEMVFRQHIIVGKKAEQNPYGIVFSELHSVALADIDGDGVKDIITGKTYWSHHKASPQWDAGAVVYWFGLQRNKDGVDWVPHLADPDSGIGRQIRIDDVNGDKLPDILVGGMKGGHLLTHKTTKVDEAAWKAAQPKVIYPQMEPLRRGPGAAIDPKSGKWEGAVEGEAMTIVGTPPGKAMVQDMEGFHPDHWSGGKQLFWTDAKPGDRLELEINAAEAGEYEVQAVFTMARDFAIIQPLMDGKALGGAMDLYNAPDVLTTGVLTLGRAQLTAGAHRFGIEVKGENPSATAGAFRVGIDCVKLVRAAAAKADATTGKRLVIVAPNRFHDSLAEYLRHKQQIMPTELVSLEKILAATAGVDDPERLKRFLYNQRESLGYVLLVGDVDVMPVRYMVLDRATPAAFDYAFYPSDLYYADLEKADGTFDDWNANKEGFHARYFGEVRGEKNKGDPINYDQVNYRPKVAVGRWPVSTVDEVKIVAAKSMAYEDGVRDGSYVGAQKAAIFHPSGWIDARQHLARLADAMPAAWVSKRYLYPDAKTSAGAMTPTQENVIAAMNAGTGLILHAGHGSEKTWEGCFSIKALGQIKNADRLPVVMSAGCSTAYFAPLAPYDGYTDVDGKDHIGTYAGEVFKEPPPPPAPYQTGKHNPTGLGEQILKRSRDGAVVYIGCCTGSQPCGLTLLDGFASAVSKGGATTRVGDCWASAERYYYEKEHLATLKPDSGWYPPSIFFQGMKFMFFGDSSLPLPVSFN